MNGTRSLASIHNPRQLIGQPAEMLDTPCLVVDLDILKSNIDNMAQNVSSHRVHLRPHIKTHKTPSIGKLQLAAGTTGITTGITTAKLSEAWVFADEGFDDILLAYQVVGKQKVMKLLELAKRVNLRTCVDNLEVAQTLSEAAISASIRIEVLLDIDTGLERTGCSPEEAEDLGTNIAGT